MARGFAKETPLMFYCDFHGHSKRFAPRVTNIC